MNVLLTSIGRRPYLVEWFQQAQVSTASNGLVITADSDPYSPARKFGDVFELAPSVRDPNYGEWLRDLLSRFDVGLAVSVNDFELSRWAELPSTPDFDALLRLSPQLQNIAEDKLEMYRVMTACGVRVPETWLLRTVLDNPSLVGSHDELVLKGRFGSASRGLRLTTADALADTATNAYTEVTFADGTSPGNLEHALDLMVVQPRILGQEHGVDVLCSFDTDFKGVLARRKLKMRFGETDQAESVEPGPFEATGAAIAEATMHRGLIDTDIIVDQEGKNWLIDLNPRFGGGYPFSHLAGANVPEAYLHWSQGTAASRALEYLPRVVGSKFVGIV